MVLRKTIEKSKLKCDALPSLESAGLRQLPRAAQDSIFKVALFRDTIITHLPHRLCAVSRHGTSGQQ
jgi:hypothetical protein